MPPVHSKLVEVYSQLPPSSYIVEQMITRMKENSGVLTLIGVGCLGLGALTAREIMDIRAKIKADRALARAQAIQAAGGVSGGKADKETKPKREKMPGSVGVNASFARRLMYILRIVIPGVLSKESLILITQTFMLIARTLISIRMAKLGGDGISAVAQRSWKIFAISLTDFGFTGVIAAVVNSALKYLSNLLSIYFRQRLTRHVHEAYLRNRNYYKAAVLAHAMKVRQEQEEKAAAEAAAVAKGDKDMTPTASEAKEARLVRTQSVVARENIVIAKSSKVSNADARVTQDLNDFCGVFSDIYSRTFKPALDMVLCTHQLANSLGYTGPIALYSYFILAGAALRTVVPPFSRLLAEQNELEANFRRSHNRLITHAEEVAFLNGGMREKQILNDELKKVTEHAQLTFFSYFRQGILDQFTMKYAASLVGWPILAVPFLLSKQENTAHIISNYRQNDVLIQQACSAIHDLVMVYKKVQRLAGLTSRVSELLEGMNEMNESSNATQSKVVEITETQLSTIPTSGSITTTLSSTSSATSSSSGTSSTPSPPPLSPLYGRTRGNVTLVPIPDTEPESITFSNVCISTPEGRLLVKDFSFGLSMGDSMMVTGPNGAGKTSLFRTLAGLWPLTSGAIIKKYHESPPTTKSKNGNDDDAVSEIFYVPQNPYLVSGSLVEQIVYPLGVPEARAHHFFTQKAKQAKIEKQGGVFTPQTFEQKVMECICIVGLRRFVAALDASGRIDYMSDILDERRLQTRHHDWADVLSGGEKQRIGLSRLFFHTPRFAVLDESTSAMNADDEGPIYQRILDEGITVFSIAHRLQLRKFHKFELRLEGDGSGGWKLNPITDSQ